MEHTSLGGPESKDPFDYSGNPGAHVVLAPARVIERAIPWLRARLDERFFMAAAARLGWSGLAATFLAGAAGIIYFLAMAVRTESLWPALACLAMPVGVALLQYCAMAFSDQCVERVRSTPTAISNFAIFDLLGTILAIGGAVIFAIALVALLRDLGTADWMDFVPRIVIGYLTFVIGALMLNPSLLNMHLEPANTVGQDGIAIISAGFKAVLSGARLAFGSIATVGALSCIIGCIWALFSREDPRGHILCLAGLALVAGAGLLPLYAYVAAAVYFVIVDALDSIIRLGRRT